MLNDQSRRLAQSYPPRHLKLGTWKGPIRSNPGLLYVQRDLPYRIT